jgi:hypothetical protein
MKVGLKAAAFGLCAAAAAAAASPLDLEGEYRLASSSTAPVSKWSYTKAHVTIRKLDDGHLLILLACEWKSEPKAVCGDHMYTQRRGDDLWLQDMNTDAMRLYFNPAARTFTIISRGFDPNGSVRRDVFTPAGAPPDDAALLRRMKRQQTGADSKENLRVFGHYSKWGYTKNRIEAQRD